MQAGTRYVHVWALGLSCEAPGGPNAHNSGTRRFKHHQNSKEGPQERGEKERKWERESGKKGENLGPHPFNPPLKAPPFKATLQGPFRAPPFRPPPPPDPEEPPKARRPPPPSPETPPPGDPPLKPPKRERRVEGSKGGFKGVCFLEGAPPLPPSQPPQAPLREGSWTPPVFSLPYFKIFFVTWKARVLKSQRVRVNTEE